MKSIIVTLAFVSFLWSARSWAGDCSAKKELDKARGKLDSYTPPPTATKGGTGPQAGSQVDQSFNFASAKGTADSCSAAMGEFDKEFDEIGEEMDADESCAKFKKDLKDAKKKTKEKKAQCDNAGDAAKKGGDKAGDNKDKMGGDKKDDKGGGGSPPQMPQIPPQKKEPTVDLLKQEQERQARIAACKNSVNSGLLSKESNCEIQFSYDPNHPVINQKQKQDECKQTAIFQSQSDLNNCELMNPPNGSFPAMPTPVIPSSTGTATSGITTTTTTTTSTSTNTSTR